MRREVMALQEKAESTKEVALYDPDQAYHVQFISPPQGGQYANEDIAMFLRRVFDGAAPLEYDRHRLVQFNEKQVVQFCFKLSIVGQLANMNFERAAKAFCKAIFKHETREFFPIITAESIFGVSAVSIAWQNWFNRAFFNAHAENALSLLSDVFDTFTTDYFSPWALVVPLAIVIGLPVGAFTGHAVMNSFQTQSAATLTVQAAMSILEAAANRQNRRPRDVILRERNEQMGHYNTNMDRAIDALDRCTDPNTVHDVANNDGMSSNAELSTALFDLARNASLMITSNKELLATYLKDRHSTQMQGWAAMAGMELSLAIVIVTTLGDMEVAAVGAAIGGPLTAIAIGGIGAAVCFATVAVKYKKEKALSRKIQVLSEMSVFIHQSWRLAYDTEQFLIWVRDTNMANPTQVQDVTQTTLLEWNNFVATVQQQRGGVSVTEDTVRAYLAIRRQTLTEIRQRVRNGEDIIKRD